MGTPDPMAAQRAVTPIAQNVAAGVAGLVIWPLWFGMDEIGASPRFR